MVLLSIPHPTQFVYVYTYYGIVNYLKKVSLNVQMNLCNDICDNVIRLINTILRSECSFSFPALEKIYLLLCISIDLFLIILLRDGHF